MKKYKIFFILIFILHKFCINVRIYIVFLNATEVNLYERRKQKVCPRSDEHS